MGLMKAPSLITFIIALLLAITALVSKLGVEIPLPTGVNFWVMFGAYVLLLLGVVTRGF